MMSTPAVFVRIVADLVESYLLSRYHPVLCWNRCRFLSPLFQVLSILFFQFQSVVINRWHCFSLNLHSLPWLIRESRTMLVFLEHWAFFWNTPAILLVLREHPAQKEHFRNHFQRENRTAMGVSAIFLFSPALLAIEVGNFGWALWTFLLLYDDWNTTGMHRYTSTVNFTLSF